MDLPKSHKEITDFHKLMLIKIMRPDRVPQALRAYVRKKFGDRYIDAIPFDIFKTYNETEKYNPMFFVLFPGVDPTPLVVRIAETLGKNLENGKFINISMGQGQEQIAIDAMNRQAENGDWLFLQNVHLMPVWTKVFEREFETTVQHANNDFRCFLSSEPPGDPQDKIIPQAVLQNSIKIANEAPQSLKDNLRRAYTNFS